MKQTLQYPWLKTMLGAVSLSAILVGCEMDSYLDPSVVGSWERTPAIVPILDNLDVIEEPVSTSVAVSQVQRQDLIPDTTEYAIGPGDIISVEVFELIVPGQNTVQTRRVDETGAIRLPVIGLVDVAGRSPSELEDDIAKILDRKGVLRDATVSVIVQQSRQNTFSIIGSPTSELSNSAVGTYVIPKPEFRLLDALALARGIPGRTRKLLIIRQSPLSQEVTGSGVPNEGQPTAPPTPEDPGELLKGLLDGLEEGAQTAVTEESFRPGAPRGVEQGLEESATPTQWVFVNGQWVRAGETTLPAELRQQQADAETEVLGSLITQRIIEVPYDRLIAGDMRYNIIIRSGDMIRVPDRSAGFVYLMGQVARPGAYTVPGEKDLTLKQLFASAGGLGPLAIPERVDLVRRVGDSQEATIRLNVRAIFEGTEPDIFLKPNDLVNVGTNFFASPLAVVRNGFRMSYGFGFVIDRNFGYDIFGSENN